MNSFREMGSCYPLKQEYSFQSHQCASWCWERVAYGPINIACVKSSLGKISSSHSDTGESIWCQEEKNYLLESLATLQADILSLSLYTHTHTHTHTHTPALENAHRTVE